MLEDCTHIRDAVQAELWPLQDMQLSCVRRKTVTAYAEHGYAQVLSSLLDKQSPMLEWSENRSGSSLAAHASTSSNKAEPIKGFLPSLNASSSEDMHWPWADKRAVSFALGAEEAVALPMLVHQRSSSTSALIL